MNEVAKKNNNYRSDFEILLLKGLIKACEHVKTSAESKLNNNNDLMDHDLYDEIELMLEIVAVLKESGCLR